MEKTTGVPSEIHSAQRRILPPDHMSGVTGTWARVQDDLMIRSCPDGEEIDAVGVGAAVPSNVRDISPQPIT
jgi:hypothetical protein